MSTLRSLREKKGLTVSQLAGKASIPSRIIADYEEGRLTITLAHAKVLAKALWVGIEDLMPPAGSIPPTASQAAVPSAPPPQRPAPPPTPTPTAAPPAPRVQQPEQQRPAPTYAANTATHQGQGYRQDRPDYSHPPAPRNEPSRPPRPSGSEGRDGAHRRPSAENSTPRPARPAPPPPSAISEGQVEELERLAAKLEIEIAQLEERIGKKVLELTRPEAKEWIKRIRGMAEEIAPSKKSAYGQWPGGHVDQEASYLAVQKESGAYFRFKLFNGEEIGGVITDYTPYTITISTNGSGDDTVIRKLAIAYYRRGEPIAAAPAAPAEPVAAAAPKRTRTTKAQAAAAAAQNGEAESHQPLDSGLSSDRPSDPQTPEIDNMDEDRGL